MGWNNLKFNKVNDDIFKYINEDDYVYFVYLYYVNLLNEELIVFLEYEKKIFVIVRKGNVYGI